LEETRSWLWTSPAAPGTAFSEFSLSPQWFYLMEWVESIKGCHADAFTPVGEGKTLRYRITRTINGFHILGITDKPVIDVQTFTTQGKGNLEKAVIFAKKEMIPNLENGFNPRTGKVTFDIPADACNGPIKAFKFKYEWKISKLLGKEVQNIVEEAAAEASPELLAEETDKLRQTMDALTRTSSLAGVIAEDETLPENVRQLAEAAAANVKANKQIHNAFSSMKAEAMQMEAEDAEHH